MSALSPFEEEKTVVGVLTFAINVRRPSKLFEVYEKLLGQLYI